MTKEQYVQEVKNLTEFSDAYYSKGVRLISDNEFDERLRAVCEYENKHKHEIKDKLCDKVGSSTHNKENFPIVKHITPMLSVDNSHLENDSKIPFSKWYFKNPRKQKVYICPKLDGRSLKLVYSTHTGKLIHALSRYENDKGMDIISNIDYVNNVPKQIDVSIFSNNNEIDYIEIVGELIIPKAGFEKAKQTDPSIKTALSMLGCITSLDKNKLQLAKDCGMQFIVHSFVPTDEIIQTFMTADNYFKKMKMIGFEVVPFDVYETMGTFDYEKITGILEEKLKYYTKSYKYECDGIVYGLNDIKSFKDAGTTAKFRKGLIAIKPVPNYTRVTIIDILWQVGLTGDITPVAVFNPIIIAGKTYNKATLHNVADMMKHQIKIGSVCKFIVSNGVIPKINGIVDEEENNKLSDLKLIKECPECSEDLTKIPDSNDSNYFTLRCENPNCGAKSLAQIVRAVSNKGLKIKGAGKSKIELLIDNDLIKHTSDLYTLRDKNKKSQLLALPRWGEKSTDNFLKAIEATVGTTEADRFIYALNISKSLSVVGAKKICESGIFTSFEKDFLMIDDISIIDGFGSKAQEDWLKFINDQTKLNEYTKMVTYVKPLAPHEVHTEPQQDGTRLYKVYISGRSNHTKYKTKSQLKTALETQYSIKVMDSFTKKIDLLLYVKSSTVSSKVSYTVHSWEEFVNTKSKKDFSNIQMKMKLDDLSII